jgi:3',5'-nucleoside bisphosphate phosphatase
MSPRADAGASPGAIDLHSHTTASDGTLTPRELVREAARRRVSVLAITDHDSTEGLAEAQAEAAQHPGLAIVPGLEINCDVEHGEIHVLGFYPDHEAAWFQEFLRAQRAERVARIHRVTDRLAELGMPVDPDDVFALVREGSAGRPHVAQVMVHHGYVRSIGEAFERFLHTGGPAYVPRHALAPAEAIRIVRRARGVPVLAHPGRIERLGSLDALLEAGLLGIECYYPEHSAGETAEFLRLCQRHDLVATGGADFHRPEGGRRLGGVAVPPGVAAELSARAERLKAG